MGRMYGSASTLRHTLLMTTASATLGPRARRLHCIVTVRLSADQFVRIAAYRHFVLVVDQHFGAQTVAPLPSIRGASTATLPRCANFRSGAEL